MNRIRRSRGVYAGLALAVVVLPPLVIQDIYVMHLLVLSAIFVMLATSLNLIIGYSGLLSLGHHAFFGLGAYTSSLTALAGVPFFAAITLGGLVAAAGARLVGTLLLRLRSAYFVIATIAVAEILRIVSLNWVELTSGPMGITNVPPLRLGLPGVGRITLDDPFGAYYLVAVLAVLSVVVVGWIVRSDMGVGLVAMKEGEHIARSLGINTARLALYSVVIGSGIAGVAGALYAHYMQFISPDVFRFLFMITMVVMVVAGGMGTLAGPVLGAFLFTFIPEYLRAGDEYRLLAYGLIVVFVVRFARAGLWGTAAPLLKRAWQRAPWGQVPPAPEPSAAPQAGHDEPARDAAGGGRPSGQARDGTRPGETSVGHGSVGAGGGTPEEGAHGA